MYECWANIVWAGSAAGARLLAIESTAAVPIIAQASLPTVATGHHIGQARSGITSIMNGVADHVVVAVYQDSGIAQNILGTSNTSADFGSSEPCHFGIKMLGSGT